MTVKKSIRNMNLNNKKKNLSFSNELVALNTKFKGEKNLKISTVIKGHIMVVG